MTIFSWALENVLHHEGGFVNHISDPGGATNFGISLRYLVARGDLDANGILDGDIDFDGDVDIDDIRGMTKNQAEAFYHDGFWLPSKCNDLKSELLAVKIFDMCVNMGRTRAWKIVQTAFNFINTPQLKVDGVPGPTTLKLVNSRLFRDYELIDETRARQGLFYLELIAANVSFQTYLVGWMRRAAA